MNRFRKFMAGGFFALMLIHLAPAAAHAQMLEQSVQVSFSAPVEIPGMVLPAGKYVFDAIEPGHLTRILSSDRTHVVATLLTVPEERNEPAEKPIVTLSENVSGTPERVVAWFYPGNLIGNEFIYKNSVTHA